MGQLHARQRRQHALLHVIRSADLESHWHALDQFLCRQRRRHRQVERGVAIDALRVQPAQVVGRLDLVQRDLEVARGNHRIQQCAHDLQQLAERGFRLIVAIHRQVAQLVGIGEGARDAAADDAADAPAN
ncbi:hypothetical protein G6F22_017526 [Rhizopus arrhizus]|nr:hypothetical protein G6F22_017526 [Rhizopus arrhizus]